MNRTGDVFEPVAQSLSDHPLLTPPLDHPWYLPIAFGAKTDIIFYDPVHERELP
jgi:hypothetical protein